MTDTKHTAALLNGDDPLIIAIDATASMNTRVGAADQPVTRAQYARERAEELLKRIPKTTRCTALAYGTALYALAVDTTAIQARASLMVMLIGEAQNNAGLVLEWCLQTYLHGQLRATLVLITDGAADDPRRWEAWHALNARYGNALHINVLTLGDVDGSAYTLGASSHFTAPLASVEFQLKTHTKSDRPDIAHADTMPPSIAPPDQRLVRVAPAAYGKTTPPKGRP